jgi:cell division protease FtsH
MTSGRMSTLQRRRRRPISPWPLLALVLLLLWVPSLVSRFFVQETPIPYSRFRSLVDAGRVDRVVLKGYEIIGTLAVTDTIPAKNGVRAAAVYKAFITRVPEISDDTLIPDLRRTGTRVEVQVDSSRFPWGLLLLVLTPVAFLALVGLGMSQGLAARGREVLGFGRSRARLYTRETSGTTFEDVAGAEGPKAELREVIEFLRGGDAYRKLGARIPKGVLLVGPPGTGKTLLARAVAGEAEVPFFHITGSGFMEMFVGVGAARVRDLFRDARRAAPAILFVDELDSIGRRRGAALGAGQDEREQTLNQLLAEMDGFEPHDKVVVLAATNRPDVLDPALLRAGRFDRRVVVDLPTSSERAAILRVHARNKPLDADLDLERLARATPGLSGADLANLLNEAALFAARRGADRIGRDDVDQARDKVLLGLPRESMVIGEDERRVLAYHEGGHAVLATLLSKTDSLDKVTIVPRGHAMGVTQQLVEERHLYDREYLLDRLATMLGGRAAEDLVFGTVTNGGEDDLRNATRLARKMVLDWGMGKSLPNLAWGARDGQGDGDLGRPREYSEATAERVDADVADLLGRAFGRARDLLEGRRTGLDRLAVELLEHEIVSGARVREILGSKPAGAA